MLEVLVIIILVLLAGTFAGLTLALFSLDLTSLERSSWEMKRQKEYMPLGKEAIYSCVRYCWPM